VEHQQEQQHQQQSETDMGFLGIKWHKPSLEYSSVVTTTSDSSSDSATVTTTAWRRPRSVTSIMRMRSRGRNDDKLLLLQNNEQHPKVAHEEDTTPSQSSASCSQEQDLTISCVQLVTQNDDKSNKNNHHEQQFLHQLGGAGAKPRCLVTPDLAAAWCNMASPDTKTDPKSTVTIAPVTLDAPRRSAMDPHELDVDALTNKRNNGGRWTRRREDRETTSLARNPTGRSLLASGPRTRGDSQHETIVPSTIYYSDDMNQDCHLNCPRREQEQTTIGSRPVHSQDQQQSYSYFDLSSASSLQLPVKHHTTAATASASAATNTTVTTSTSSSFTSCLQQSHCRPRDSTSSANVNEQRIRSAVDPPAKTTRMPPQSDSVEVEVSTMSPTSSPTTAASTKLTAMTESTTATSPTTATTRTEKGKSNDGKSDWKAAVDPKSGRTYYYHGLTRETQWSMPISMASDVERAAMEERERRQREFFALMESNILKSISSGAFNNSNSNSNNTNAATATDTQTNSQTDTESQSHPKEIVLTEALGRPPQALPRPAGLVRTMFPQTATESQRQTPKEIVLTEDCLGRPPQPLPRPAGLVRTISTMDESVLRALVQRVPSYRNMNALPTDDLEISFAPQPNEGITGGSINNGGNGKYGRNANKANKLLSIQEALQNSWSQTDNTTCQGMHHLSINEDKIMATIGESQHSMGSLLAGLPEDGDHNDGDDVYNGEMSMSTRRSFYGPSFLDESYNQLGLTAEEFEAMQSLANMTDEIANVNDSDSDDNIHKLNPVLEGDDNDCMDYNNNSSMGNFDFDLDDSSQSSSFHLGSEYGIGRDPAATTAAALPQDDDSGASLSLSSLDASSCLQSLSSLASCGTTSAEKRPATSCGATPGLSTRPRPATARPLSQRKVTVAESSPGMEKPGLQRRNTCSTLYVGSTMSEPDKDATIKVRCITLLAICIELSCVCGVASLYF
jgi:hypothetical protein